MKYDPKEADIMIVRYPKAKDSVRFSLIMMGIEEISNEIMDKLDSIESRLIKLEDEVKNDRD